jgi:hypothetical protein
MLQSAVSEWMCWWVGVELFPESGFIAQWVGVRCGWGDGHSCLPWVLPCRKHTGRGEGLRDSRVGSDMQS